MINSDVLDYLRDEGLPMPERVGTAAELALHLETALGTIALSRRAFVEDQHPRGQPDNAGQFASKSVAEDEPELDEKELKRRRGIARWNAKSKEYEKRTGGEVWDLEGLTGDYDEQVKQIEQRIQEHADKPLKWEPENPFALDKFSETTYEGEPAEKMKLRADKWYAMHDVRTHFRDALAEAEHIPRDKKTKYLATVQKVIEWMPTKALHAMRDNVKKTTFYASIGELTEQMLGRGMRDRGRIGGCWEHDGGEGELHLDGDLSDSVDSRGVYAHEFGHACDWIPGTEGDEVETEHGTIHTGTPGKHISNSWQWSDAFHAELGNEQLSRYASTNLQEGFAEFARLVWGTGQRQKDVAESFPMCYAVFKSHGLV